MPSAQGMHLSWHLRRIDIGGPYCPTKMDAATTLDVLSKLSQFETMLWREIEGSKHHAIGVDTLSNTARKRLEELENDEVEELFSLRLTGPNRVIGIRDHAVFRLLWWDPGHEVCPSRRADN